MTTGDTIYVVVSDHHSCGVQILGLYELREDAMERARREVEDGGGGLAPIDKCRWQYGPEGDTVWIEEWDWKVARKGRRVS